MDPLPHIIAAPLALDDWPVEGHLRVDYHFRVAGGVAVLTEIAIPRLEALRQAAYQEARRHFLQHEADLYREAVEAKGPAAVIQPPTTP